MVEEGEGGSAGCGGCHGAYVVSQILEHLTKTSLPLGQSFPIRGSNLCHPCAISFERLQIGWVAGLGPREGESLEVWGNSYPVRWVFSGPCCLGPALQIGPV